MKICAPFAGIIHYAVAEGTVVDTGSEIATVEALKLEAPVLAPGPGVVSQLLQEDFASVQGGEALVELIDVEGR
ncbi:MAG TPA: acetyl-CoA carboxylase biotin carboxyl carrier protein subunit [Candidatus Corynebacterium gallistercoris]|uniref:Acetyl-CoA carboxylase biotin carboxyl carrier protein subunit n=1 Tax=Candidatus Corynebacterium gallistercoris TaxID=2838530 RepID=A0A9D1RZF5_9CORY|nr:acetyl-CoA carboxylase biotin carboxyl carrier protein subunit [Candidatus Corynebacterium gallistercoris]